MVDHQEKSEGEKLSQKSSNDKTLWAIFGPPGRGKSIINLDQEIENWEVAPDTEIDSYELPKE